MSKMTGFSGYRLACLWSAACLTVAVVLGCGGESTGPSQSSEAHGKKVVDVNKNYMKTKPKTTLVGKVHIR